MVPPTHISQANNSLKEAIAFSQKRSYMAHGREKQIAPLPWRLDEELLLHDAEGRPIAWLWDGRTSQENERLAREIIEAVQLARTGPKRAPPRGRRTP